MGFRVAIRQPEAPRRRRGALDVLSICATLAGGILAFFVILDFLSK